MQNRKNCLLLFLAVVALLIGVANLFTRPAKAETAQTARMVATSPPARPVTKLRVDQAARRGEMVEVIGQTDPDAEVTINGNAVPYVAKDGSFSYFLRLPAPDKSTTVTVVAQAAGKEPATVEAPITR